MDLPDSYDNWILRYDLHCASGMKIGMISAIVFIGWIVTLTFLPNLSDTVFGRQRLMIPGYLLTLAAYTLLLFSQTYELLLLSLLIIGSLLTVRVQVSVTYLYETLTRANYYTIYTAIAMTEGIVGFIAALYFKYGSK